jgi:glycine/D-amino acid oxidase-like deaminating enzyme/nitrite reductase/ring-hydroxylating ferredoxin subunit
MKSIWMKDYIKKNLPSINKNIDTPILIIGGGIAGLMCAYNFMKNGLKFILVDSKTLASGVSSNTTAQVSISHDKLYNEISKKHGEEQAVAYLKSQMEGLEIIKQIIKVENINCDYKEESTILCAKEEKNIKTLKEQYEMIKNHSNIKLLTSQKDILSYEKAIEFKKQFIFNPMKYMMGIIDILIKNNTPLYEKSRVTRINKMEDNYEVLVNNKYKINTNKIIMACHYPFLNPDNLYFAKIYQSKSYAIAFKSNLKLKANYVSLDKPYYYIRTYDDSTLIIGGSDHYTGINIDIDKCYEILINKIYQLDKDAKIQYKWFTEDCMPIDSLPFVGSYSNKNPNIILISGFQKWGFTNSHIAAKNVTNMLNNKTYDDLYKTNRYTLIRDLKSTFRIIAHSLDGLIISKLLVGKYELEKIKIGSGKVMKYNNINALVYREDKDKYIFLKNKCTHMGCSLIWNDVDKVWESKCHGSIFDKYGHVIYGPALKDLEKIKFTD